MAGSVWKSVLSMGNFGDDEPDYGKMMQEEEKKRKKRINQGFGLIDAQYAGFNPAYYERYEKDYRSAAMPSVADSFRTALATNRFNLANQGLVGGSVAKQNESKLARAWEDSKQRVGSAAREASQAQRTRILDSRMRLIDLLYRSADPVGTNKAAIEISSQFRQPSVQQPIADFWSSNLGGMGGGQ